MKSPHPFNAEMAATLRRVAAEVEARSEAIFKVEVELAADFSRIGWELSELDGEVLPPPDRVRPEEPLN